MASPLTFNQSPSRKQCLRLRWDAAIRARPDIQQKHAILADDIHEFVDKFIDGLELVITNVTPVLPTYRGIGLPQVRESPAVLPRSKSRTIEWAESSSRCFVIDRNRLVPFRCAVKIEGCKLPEVGGFDKSGCQNQTRQDPG